MYICKYVYMYICKYVNMYICKYVYMYICIYVHMYICICINVFEYKYTWGKTQKPAIFLIRYGTSNLGWFLSNEL